MKSYEINIFNTWHPWQIGNEHLQQLSRFEAMAPAPAASLLVAWERLPRKALGAAVPHLGGWIGQLGSTSPTQTTQTAMKHGKKPAFRRFESVFVHSS